MALAGLIFTQPGFPGSDLAERVRAIVPAGTQIEVRSLDRTMVEMHFPEGSPEPVIVVDPEQLPPPFGAAVIVTTFPQSLARGYAAAWNAVERLHEQLGAKAAGLFDLRAHGAPHKVPGAPTTLALAMTRRHRDMDHSDYMHYYLGTHVPMALELQPPLVVRYRTFGKLHALGELEADSITFQEFDSPATLEEFFTARYADGDEARDDAAKFIDTLHYYLSIGG